MELTFVSYDGEYPNLCSGKLILAIDGKEVVFPDFCLYSNGSCWITRDDEEIVTAGRWEICEFPEGFPPELKEKATDLVNENVRYGCCGGCI